MLLLIGIARLVAKANIRRRRAKRALRSTAILHDHRQELPDSFAKSTSNRNMAVYETAARSRHLVGSQEDPSLSRSERLFELLQALRRYRRPVSGKTLAAEIGVSIRTLYRDIASLQAQGANIEGEAGLGMSCGRASCCRR